MELTTNLAGLDLRAEIDRLRKERNAVILAHYYQKPEFRTSPISSVTAST